MLTAYECTYTDVRWVGFLPPLRVPVVVCQKSRESFRVELIVAQVERRVDRLERLEVDVDLFLLPLVGDNGAAVDDQGSML